MRPKYYEVNLWFEDPEYTKINANGIWSEWIGGIIQNVKAVVEVVQE